MLNVVVTTTAKYIPITAIIICCTVQLYLDG